MTGLPPDPFPNLDPHPEHLRAAAFTAYQIARQLCDAAAVLGLDPGRYARLLEATTTVNRHFHPAVRLQHGQPP